MPSGILRSTDALRGLVPGGSVRAAAQVAPSQLLFTGEDGLRLSAVNVVSGVRLVLTARWLPEDGDEVQALEYELRPRADGAADTLDIPLGRGLLLNLLVAPLGAIVYQGECFVRVDIIRGRDATITIGTLLSGYVGSWGGRGWPGTILETPGDGPGHAHLYQSDMPAAGANVTLTFEAEARYRIRSVIANLTTSAALGNRGVYAFVFQNTNEVFQSPSSYLQGPSKSIVHSWGAGMTHVADPNNFSGIGGLPVDLMVETGAIGDATFEMRAFPMDAADQWSPMNLLVEEWRNPVTTLV